MALIEPLDLQSILVDKLAGGASVFVFLALVVIAIFAGRSKMPNSVFLAMVLVFFALLSGISAFGQSTPRGLILLIIIVMAMILGKLFTKD